MKRRIIGIISIIIVLLLIPIVSIYFINKDYTNRQINAFINRYQTFYQYINKHPLYDEGVVDVNANYRGAHGENYPNKFTFNYKLDNSVVYFSNELGYREYESDDKIYELMKRIRKLNPESLNNIMKDANVKDNKIIIDKDRINEITNLDINNMSITFNSSNMLKKLKNTIINIDDMTIKIENNNIGIKYKNNNISIRINSAGYFLNINDNLKMNAFLNDNKNTYSIIIKDKVLSIEITDSELKVNGNFASTIYNSIELSINKQDAIIDNNRELEVNDIPILRYFTNAELSYWK